LSLAIPNFVPETIYDVNGARIAFRNFANILEELQAENATIKISLAEIWRVGRLRLPEYTQPADGFSPDPDYTLLLGSFFEP